MKPPRSDFKHGFAIVRLDFFDGKCPTVTVKKVVWDIEFAKKEVERLNLLNKDSVYFWQITRVENSK